MINLITVENSDSSSLEVLQKLENQIDFNVLLQAKTEKKLFEFIELTNQEIVDLVIFDLDEFDIRGFALAKILAKQFPKSKFIIINNSQDLLGLKLSLEAGFKGYVDRDSAVENIVDTVRRVADGYLQISPNLCDRAIANFTKEESRILEKVTSFEQEYNFKFDSLEQQLKSTNKKDRDLLYVELTAQTNNLKLELRSRLETLQERIDQQVTDHLGNISNQFGIYNFNPQVGRPYKFAMFNTQLNNNRLSIGKLEKQLIWLSYGFISLGLMYLLEKIVAFFGS